MEKKQGAHSSLPKKPVAILGATGLVGRRFSELLIDHPWFEIGMLVGSDASNGRSYQDVWTEKESTLQRHYGSQGWHPHPFPALLQDFSVQSFDELLASDISLIFSSLPIKGYKREERLLEAGKRLFSNSPYGRFEPPNPLVIAEVNKQALRDQQFIKNPNCVTSGLTILLAPLLQRYGLEEVSVTTYQSLSGRGDAKYDLDLVENNVYPLHRSPEATETYIVQEVKKILGNSFLLSVSCNRVWVQEGHYIDVRLKTGQPIAQREEVIELFQSFNPLAPDHLPSSPAHPIVVTREVGRPRPRQDAWHHHGMAIAVGNISIEDEIYDLRFSYVVNNLIRGAAGGAILNAEVFWSQREKQCQIACKE